MKKNEDPLVKQKRLQQEEQGFKAMFKHNALGPIAMGAVVGIGGAPARSRTADLLITNQLLYQLSYKGINDFY